MSIGNQGIVQLSLLSGPSPVVQLQVRLSEQLAVEVDGTELRGVRALAFNVPRVAGSYNLTVFAMDMRGCSQETTTARAVTVQ